jgi:HK97 gp10 family phage protein
MRVGNWKAKDVFKDIAEQAFQNAELVMDDVVQSAKAHCPVGKAVSKSGKDWTERVPGSLRNTIRRVSRRDKGNIRVYAGSKKVFYARFVEMGTVKMRKKPYLRPAFQQRKGAILKKVKYGK